MAKILSFKQGVRRLNGLTNFWVDKETTQISNNKGTTIIFQRWFDCKSYRSKWKPFNEFLRRNNNIEDIWQIVEVANKYDIEMTSPTRGAKEIPADIYEYPTRFIWRNNEKRNYRV